MSSPDTLQFCVSFLKIQNVEVTPPQNLPVNSAFAILYT